MRLEGKKFLVTGGTGFIGRQFVQELERWQARVRVPIHRSSLSDSHESVETVRADLTLPEDCRAASRGVDYIIHAAGTVGAAGISGLDQMEGITLNLILTAQMLKAAWEEGVKGILIFGSSTGYPALNHAVTEDEMWLGEPHLSYFGYGWMRRYIERLGEYVSRQSATKVVVIRPSAVYGPWDNFSNSSGHVIPALIKRAIEKEDPFVVWGTGNEVRDFVHVSDFVRGCLRALDISPRFEWFNIGAGRSTTVREVVGLILDASGHGKASLVFDETKPTTIPYRLLDIEKARHTLGFEPVITLEEGIRETVEWYMSRAT